MDTVTRCDPFAAALANASLLGAGYVMLGRPRLAAGTGVVTAVLVVILASVDPPAWPWRAVLLLWWLAVTVHAWHLAGMPITVDLAQRLAAIGVTGAILLAVCVLRIDAWRIERDAAEFHRDGNCANALTVLDRLGSGHRVAYGSLAARAHQSEQACKLLLASGQPVGYNRLREIETLETYRAHPGALWEGADERQLHLLFAQVDEELATALTGDLDSLRDGFAHMSMVLEGFSGQEQAVGTTLDGFLARLAAEHTCTTKAITDWLASRPASDDVLDRSSDAVPRIAPAAIVGCGDDRLAHEDWREARTQYRQLLDQYPDHDLAGKARRGLRKANLGIELEKVRDLINDRSGGLPAYCDKPARYRGADPYKGGGPHRTLLFGDDESRDTLPSSWLAGDAAGAVLVICADEGEFGSVVETCQYEETIGGAIYSVTFRTRKVDLRVYEVRTGDLVADTSVEIGGHCPGILTYYGSPPSQEFATSTESDVRAAYQRLINP